MGRRVFPDNTVDLELTITVHRDGKEVDRIVQHSTAGITERATIHRFLTETGFEIRQEFGSYDRAPYRDGDSVLIIEATKL